MSKGSRRERQIAQCEDCHAVFRVGFDNDSIDRVPKVASHCYHCGGKLRGDELV